MTTLKAIWTFLDGNKTLIGMSVFFITDHLLMAGTWYSDLLNIIGYSLIALGGGHKLIKARYGSKESSERKRKSVPTRPIH